MRTLITDYSKIGSCTMKMNRKVGRKCKETAENVSKSKSKRKKNQFSHMFALQMLLYKSGLLYYKLIII